MTLKFGAKECFVVIISILLLTDIVILLNISFLMQVIGFLFLTLLPGVLILQILKLNKVDFLEKFILTWGISISFLMLFGVFINNLSLGLGYKTPLATIPLLISFNIAFIILSIIGYKRNENLVFSLPKLDLITSEKAFLIVPILFPALSIFGMHIMNTTDNNVILMVLLFLIPIYVVFVCFFNHKFPKKLYPVVIFLISISLLLLLSLRSNHIIGNDTHTEYYFFWATLNNLQWSVRGNSVLDSCLSISLLPTIYKSILNINPEFLFKILYSLLYSVSPLVIYVISKKYVEVGYAFLASCFFMFQTNFLFTEYNARTNTAIFFFALAMMVLFNDKIDPLKKRILFIVFMASCMVSHYSTTYIFFFIMLGTFVGIELLSKKYPVKKVVSLTIVVLFISIIFFWYSQVTETSFNSGVLFIENTLTNLNRFFIEESRGSPVQTLLGKSFMQLNTPYKIQFVFTWLMFALVGIGIITLLVKRNEMSFPELKFKKPDFLKDKFEVTYLVIALACSGLLIAMVALPFISTGYNLDRLYGVVTTILSVFFVIGGIILSKYFFFFTKHFFSKERTCAKNISSFGKAFLYKKRFVLKEKNNCFFGRAFFSKERFEEEKGSEVRAYLVILLVLIPYFLCTTGVMYNIFGVQRAIILNSEGVQCDKMYVHDQGSDSARWLRDNGELENTMIYTDAYGGGWLRSQAGIWRYDGTSLFKEDRKIKGYIYLRYCNVVDDKLLDRASEEYNITEYSNKFAGKGKIYNNGGSEVWK